ncbi:MAG: hypothetical protein ACKVON_08840 [Beijerinckiaceae bacterium]
MGTAILFSSALAISYVPPHATGDASMVLDTTQAEAERMLDRGNFRALLEPLPTFWGHTRG